MIDFSVQPAWMKSTNDMRGGSLDSEDAILCECLY